MLDQVFKRRDSNSASWAEQFSTSKTKIMYVSQLIHLKKAFLTTIIKAPLTLSLVSYFNSFIPIFCWSSLRFLWYSYRENSP